MRSTSFGSLMFRQMKSHRFAIRSVGAPAARSWACIVVATGQQTAARRHKTRRDFLCTDFLIGNFVDKVETIVYTLSIVDLVSCVAERLQGMPCRALIRPDRAEAGPYLGSLRRLYRLRIQRYRP